MDLNKHEIGDKIRQIRLSRNKTQSEICGDEANISLRQLQRIEAGTSIPKIETLYILASQLSVPVTNFFDSKSNLSKDYLLLKDKLVFLSLYDEQVFIEKQKFIYEQIKHNHFDTLPQKEKDFFYFHQANSDISVNNNILKAKKILKENFCFEKLSKIEFFSINDLLLIKLKLYESIMTSNINDEFDNLINLLISNSVKTIYIEAALVLDCFIIAINAYFKKGNINKVKLLLGISESIMINNKLYHKQPILKMIGAKIRLFYHNEKEKAAKLYNDAINVANNQKNYKLEKKIKKEYQQDLEIYNAYTQLAKGS